MFCSLQARTLSRGSLPARLETVRFLDESVWESEENIHPLLIDLRLRYNATAVK